MKVIDKILLSIMIIVSILVSLFLLAIAWSAIPSDFLNEWIYHIYHNFNNSLILTGIALVGIIISLRLIVGGFSKPVAKQKYVTLGEEAGNSIRISVDTIKVIAHKCVLALEGINDVKTKVISAEEGVTILLNLSLDEGVEIPQKSAEAQNTAKQNVETLTGLSVKGISISIENAS